MKTKTIFYAIFIMAIVILFGAGCGAGTLKLTSPLATAPLSTPTDIAPSSLNGVWMGTTSMGKAFSFLISDSMFTEASVMYDISCASNVKTSARFAQPVSVTSFTLTSSGPKTIVINGTFESATEASGDLVVSGTDLLCGEFDDVKATWTAQRSAVQDTETPAPVTATPTEKPVPSTATSTAASTATSTASGSPAAKLLGVNMIATCQWDVRMYLTGFAPRSVITVTSNYSEVDCASGNTVTLSWTEPYDLKTDKYGSLMIAYLHEGTGGYIYTFVDTMGNQASLSLTTSP